MTRTTTATSTTTTTTDATSEATTRPAYSSSRLQIESQVNESVEIRVVLSHPSNGTEFYNRTRAIPSTQTTYLDSLVEGHDEFQFTIRLDGNESVSKVVSENEGYEVTIRDHDTVTYHELSA